MPKPIVAPRRGRPAQEAAPPPIFTVARPYPPYLGEKSQRAARAGGIASSKAASNCSAARRA